MNNTDPRYTIYQQAIVFWLAYERCMIHIYQQGQAILPVPAMANSAFSIELFLKAMLEENNIFFNKNKGHRLDYLFHLLPDETRKSIIDATNNSEFEKNISLCGKAFEDFRYLHEDIFQSQKFNLQFWENFINAVYTIANFTIVNKGSPISMEL